jgi:CHAT domain-containing protein
MPPIRAARWEGEQFRERVFERFGANGFKMLDGEEANLDNVRAMLPESALLHLAAHGAWNPDEPLESALFLAGTDRITIGNLLGGARLDNARLVTLAACELAQGHRQSGSDDYLGLPAVFAVLGAKTVVGSLWAANDLAAAILFDRFYDGVFAGMPLDLALGRAQRYLRRLETDAALQLADAIIDATDDLPGKLALGAQRNALTRRGPRPFEHPIFWAPFQVIGSPDPL